MEIQVSSPSLLPGLTPILVFNGVRDAPVGKFQVAAPKLCEEDQNTGMKGVRLQGQLRCVNVKMNFCTEAQGRVSLLGSVGKVLSPSRGSWQI